MVNPRTTPISRNRAKARTAKAGASKMKITPITRLESAMARNIVLGLYPLSSDAPFALKNANSSSKDANGLDAPYLASQALHMTG